MAKKVSQITLTQNTPGWSLTDLSSAVLGVFATYTVPSNGAIVFKANDYCEFYLKDAAATPAELDGSIPVQVDIQQPLVLRTEVVTNDQYSAYKQSQSQLDKRRNGQSVVAPPNSIVRLSANPNASVASLDASACRWTLTASFVQD